MAGPDRRPTGGALDRLVPEPTAPKVPEILVVFWVAKLLTTAGGESVSDYLARFGNGVGGGTELLVFAVGAVAQLRSRRYNPLCYWLFAYAIAIFGTGVTDFVHLDLHVSYAGTTALWSVVLAVAFLVWHRTEGTLSIHSVTTRRRELYYWTVVFATFALGTALGDLAAVTLHLGYAGSIVLFGLLILVPAAAWRLRWLPPIPAFWAAYVLTRPLGASVADYLRLPVHAGGVGWGDGTTTVLFTVLVAVVVGYLLLARPDVSSRPAGASATTDL